MGGNPSFLLFLIFYFVLFVVVISRIDIFASKFGGRSLSAHSGFSILHIGDNVSFKFGGGVNISVYCL